MKMADVAVRAILARIVSGEFSVGAALPSEAALAADLQVSRLTAREAIRDLAASGVIEVVQGRNNRVCPTNQWSVLSAPVVEALAHIEETSDTLLADLLEARRALEVPIVRLAATRMSAEHLEQLRDSVRVMEETEMDSSRAAVYANVQADIRFHETIIEASGNTFLIAVYAPLHDMLEIVRLHTSSVQEIRSWALKHHRAILAALEDRDPDAAAAAMSAHMDQTFEAHRSVDLTRSPVGGGGLWDGAT